MWQSTHSVCPEYGPAVYSPVVEMTESPVPGTNCSWHPPQNVGWRSFSSDASAHALWSVDQSCGVASSPALPPTCSESSTSWQPRHVTPRLLWNE